MIFRKLTKLSLLVTLSLTSYSALAEATDSEVDNIASMSLEELMNYKVYSASKRPEKLSEIPAAAYVITSEDIAKAGVNSIPEALRLAPGVQVARSNAHTWAISIRGFNRQFSNKLLVLIDGRTVYTPLFSGVYWDVQDYILEDIDRIEVIRGPGGTLWGANAVNGVINIITKEARKTVGNYASTTVGTDINNITEIRHGRLVDKYDFLRIYGKYKNQDEFKSSAAPISANDRMEQGRVGFRYDFRGLNYDPMTLQGDFYSGQRAAIFQPPSAGNQIFGEHHEGGNLMFKWDFELSKEVDGKLNAYVDYIYRDSDFLVEQQKMTYNVEAQIDFTKGRHDIITGIELRHITDDLTGTQYLSYSPDELELTQISYFAQDRITLVDNKLFLTLGAKFDYNEFTHFEFQPNARILWQVAKDHSLWAAISRAVRTPSRGEDGINLAVGGAPFGGAFNVGNRQFESENLTAYEIGYRGDITKSLFLDIAAFYNDYSDLRTFTDTDPSPLARIISENNGYGESYGVEIAAVLGVTKDLDLKLSSTFLEQHFHVNAGASDFRNSLENDEDRSPDWQHSLSAHYKIREDLRADTWIYYVSDLQYFAGGNKIEIDDYTRFDLGLTWEPKENLEIRVQGQNLLDRHHQEFDEVIYSTASEVPRSFYIQAKYKF
jgi:iron complex outermembrane receptor protein